MFDYAVLAQKYGKKVAREIFRKHKQLPGFFTFLPNRPQAEFAKAIGTLINPPKKYYKYRNNLKSMVKRKPYKRILLMTSANGTGKTTITINILLNIIYGPQNLWRNVKDHETGEVYESFFKYPIYQQWPMKWPKKIWIVGNSDGIENYAEEFQKWMKPDMYKITYKADHKPSKIYFYGTDFVGYFKTHDQDVKTFESHNIGIIVLDEPAPQQIFRACVSRLRAGGFMLMPATPLTGSAYMLDEIVKKVENYNDKYHQSVTMFENSIEDFDDNDMKQLGLYEMIQEEGITWKNPGLWAIPRMGLHPKGNLTKEDIYFQINNFDKDELKPRVFGKFYHLTGLIFKTYEQAKHLKYFKVNVIVPRVYMYRMIIDPHERRPPAIVWMRKDKYNRIQIIYEWPNLTRPEYNFLPYHKIKDAAPLTISDFIRIIRDIEKNVLKIPLDRMSRFMDPNFGNKPIPERGVTVKEQYEHIAASMDYPLMFSTDINDSFHDGVQIIRNLLKTTLEGDQLLTVHANCTNVDYSFRNLGWKELTPKQQEIKELSTDVKEIGKDFNDVIRYGVIVPWPYVPLKYKQQDPSRDYSLHKDEGNRFEQLRKAVSGPDSI